LNLNFAGLGAVSHYGVNKEDALSSFFFSLYESRQGRVANDKMSQNPLFRGEISPDPDRQAMEFANAEADQLYLFDVLGERLRFESLLSRLLAAFTYLPVEDVDGQIERGLQEITEFLEIERSNVSQFSENGQELVVTHSWATEGFTPFPRGDIAGPFPWFAARLRHGEVVRLPRLPEDLPSEAVAERQFCLQAGLRSCLAIPFKVGESILGGIGFESYRQPCDWAEDLIQSLTLVSEVFANAVARQRADKMVRESEGRFRLLAESAPVMVWMSGQDRLCIYFNHRWLDFTGRSLQQELGNGWSESVHPDDLQRCLDTYVRAFDARQEFRMEYRLRRFDGEYRWILDSGVPRFESDGSFDGYIGSCIDITDQKRVQETLLDREARLRQLLDAEEESRKLREQLARVTRVSMMGEMSASIAHEVNQPLCAIVSNAQAVQRMLSRGGFVLEELLEALSDITQDAQRASAVIARIRGLIQDAPARRARVDVNELIEEMVVLMGTELSHRNITVSLELTPQLPSVLADRVQIQQVILNFMTNAADAMDSIPKDRRALILRSTRDANGGVTLAVQDTGVGLDPQKIDRVFEPFFTTKRGGTGLGLAICKSIVEGHGGRIDASSNPDAGAVFHFTLPGNGPRECPGGIS
jgi:PAS domain S-box-containing protein